MALKSLVFALVVSLVVARDAIGADLDNLTESAIVVTAGAGAAAGAEATAAAGALAVGGLGGGATSAALSARASDFGAAASRSL